MPERAGGSASPTAGAESPDGRAASVHVLLAAAGARALLVLSAAGDDPDRSWFTTPAKLGEALVVVPAGGAPRLGYWTPMERDEAASTGLDLLTPEALDIPRWQREAASPGALLADELTYTHSNGRVETKEQFLAALASGALEYLAIVSEGESAVRLYADGEVGLIAGAARVTVRTGGREGAVTLRYTSVYVHRDGRWQLVAWHSSAVPSS